MSQFGGGIPTVLLAEDSEDTRQVLSLELRQRGCRVVTAADGQEAVETALAARPDLILMDLHMPRLDGPAATAQLRAHGELEAVPVIAVTAPCVGGPAAFAFSLIIAEHPDDYASR